MSDAFLTVAWFVTGIFGSMLLLTGLRMTKEDHPGIVFIGLFGPIALVVGLIVLIASIE